MNKKFIGRKKELAFLNQYINPGNANLIVIKGRRATIPDTTGYY